MYIKIFEVMEMSLDTIVQILTVAATCGAAFHWVCLRPLNESIIKLNTMVDKQTRLIGEAQIKLAEVDQRARSAHHRLDDLVQEVHALGNHN